MPRLALAPLFVAAIANAAYAQQADLAQARAKELKAGIKSFRLQLNYNGDEDKPFYRLALRVGAVEQSGPFKRLVSITEEQATKIIDHLGADGFLRQAKQWNSLWNTPLKFAKPQGYVLKVSGFADEQGRFRGDLFWYEELGFDPAMLKRLDGLRKVLDGDAAKEMDSLLGRLSGHRRQWTAQLIRQLGDDKLAVREDATDKLTELGEASHPLLKEALQRADLDMETRSRIKIVLGEKANEGQSVTDPASGVTVAITGDGNELTATKGGNIIWKTRWTGAKAVTVRIEAGLEVVSPENVAYDPATGKMMLKR
jgi:hypothetical protein